MKLEKGSIEMKLSLILSLALRNGEHVDETLVCSGHLG